jgi:hypothetical protein
MQRFISYRVNNIVDMLEELLAMGAIIAACAAGTWYAKNKFQPMINLGMEKQKAKEATLRRR